LGAGDKEQIPSQCHRAAGFEGFQPQWQGFQQQIVWVSGDIAPRIVAGLFCLLCCAVLYAVGQVGNNGIEVVFLEKAVGNAGVPLDDFKGKAVCFGRGKGDGMALGGIFALGGCAAGFFQVGAVLEFCRFEEFFQILVGFGGVFCIRFDAVGVVAVHECLEQRRAFSRQRVEQTQGVGGLKGRNGQMHHQPCKQLVSFARVLEHGGKGVIQQKIGVIRQRKQNRGGLPVLAAVFKQRGDKG
jgi:hypothetical protein